MSFNTLKKDALLTVAAEYGVEVAEDATREEIIAALAEDGVEFADAKRVLAPAVEETVQEEPAVVEAPAKKAKAEPQSLLRMMRENRTFEIRGYRFTHDHPFQLVTESDGEWIVQNIEGFRFATPGEAREYYG